MDQQHTPGHWKVEADEEKARLHPCYLHRFVTAGDEESGTWEIVARMSDAPNQEANARLIAAAPELLKALETTLLMLEWIEIDNIPPSYGTGAGTQQQDSYHQAHATGLWLKNIGDARATIQKAKGT